MVRRLSCKQQVIGSSPIRGSIQKVATPQRKLRCRHFLRSGAKRGFVSHSVGHFFVTVPLHSGGGERQVAHPTRAWTTYCLSTVYLL